MNELNNCKTGDTLDVYEDGLLAGVDLVGAVTRERRFVRRLDVADGELGVEVVVLVAMLCTGNVSTVLAPRHRRRRPTNSQTHTHHARPACMAQVVIFS